MLADDSGRGAQAAANMAYNVANGWKQLVCPKWKQRCGIEVGRAAELPINYDIMGV